jgi:hypothetical protein
MALLTDVLLDVYHPVAVDNIQKLFVSDAVVVILVNKLINLQNVLAWNPDATAVHSVDKLIKGQVARKIFVVYPELVL